MSELWGRNEELVSSESDATPIREFLYAKSVKSTAMTFKSELA